MSLLHALRFRFRALAHRGRMDADIDEEMAFHIDAHAAELVARGMTQAAAHREARRVFGGRSGYRDDVRDAEGFAFWHALRQHAAFAVRGLRRSPGFTAMAVLTLGLGIGANGAMFGIVDRLLLRGPEGVVAPGQLRRAYVTSTNPDFGALTTDFEPYAFYTLLRDDVREFVAVGASTPPRPEPLGRDAQSARVDVVRATSDFFTTLGVQPVLGRFYDAAEDRPEHAATVGVVSYGLWSGVFGADSAIVGHTFTLGGRQITIVGVAPPGFTGAIRGNVDVWLPLGGMKLGKDWPTKWNWTGIHIVARVKPGGAIGVANAQATAALHHGYTGRDASMTKARVRLLPISYSDSGVEPAGYGVARMLWGMAVVVLLIAATNITNLLLARAARRRRELGVRVALGACRARLAGMLFSEAAMLAVLGGVTGLLVAYWGGALIRRTLRPTVVWAGPPVDVSVLIYTAVAVLGTALVVGVIPAIRAARGDPIGALKSGASQSGTDHGRTRVALQVVQAALSVVLLFTAGLFVRNLLDVRAMDLGMQPGRVLVVSVAFPRRPVRSLAELDTVTSVEHARFRRLVEQVRHLPGVADAGVAIGLPFYSQMGVNLRLPGRDSLPSAPGGGPWINAVTPDYFTTIGTGLLRGRRFSSADHEGSEPVVIVNAIMASTFWPREDALGKCLVINDANGCARVVGVVPDVHQWKLRENPPMGYYVPMGQERGIGGPLLLVRPTGDVDAFAGTLHAALVRFAPEALGVRVKSLEASIDSQVRPWRVGALMFGLFGLLALIVAAMGLFSVVSYLVAQRTHELGVRIALGARRGRIVAFVLRGGLGAAVTGIAVGIAMSLALAPILQPYLFDGTARDPRVLAVVAGVLFATSLLAGLGPSWRACRIDPTIALRAD